MRKKITVVSERLWRELNNEICLSLITLPKAKQGLGTEKFFGKKLSDYSLIVEECSYYLAEVADLLRQQNNSASLIEVSLQTNYQSTQDHLYYNNILITLENSSNSTMKLTKAALKSLKHIYIPRDTTIRKKV